MNTTEDWLYNGILRYMHSHTLILYRYKCVYIRTLVYLPRLHTLTNIYYVLTDIHYVCYILCYDIYRGLWFQQVWVYPQARRTQGMYTYTIPLLLLATLFTTHINTILPHILYIILIIHAYPYHTIHTYIYYRYTAAPSMPGLTRARPDPPPWTRSRDRSSCAR